MIELMREVQTVDIDGGEDAMNRRKGKVLGDGPLNHVEVFLAHFELVDDPIEEHVVVIALLLEQAEFAAFQFDPERLALEMFQPFRSQVTRPVFADPILDCLLADISSRFFAAIPLKLFRLDPAIRIEANRANSGRKHGQHPRSIRSASGLWNRQHEWMPNGIEIR